jgi:hypothetical protein
MLCTQFYCNAPTHQESVWIHISVVGRSHFVITPPPPPPPPPPPSQNRYVRPCLYCYGVPSPPKINVTNQPPMLLLNNQYWATTFKSTLQLSTAHFPTIVISELNI